MNKILKDYQHYLKIKGLSAASIKNYLSDVRKFLNWKKTEPGSGTSFEPGSVLDEITPQILNKYKLYLTRTNVPAKTTNRHFSSLRSFGEFLKREKLLMINPAHQLENIPQKQIIKENPQLDTQQKITELLEKHKKTIIISLIVLGLIIILLILGIIAYKRLSKKAEEAEILLEESIFPPPKKTSDTETEPIGKEYGEEEVEVEEEDVIDVTVDYALNARALQGHTPSASGSANKVLVITEDGDLVLGEQDPGIYATDGLLTISADEILMMTNLGTNGNITLAPDGSGALYFRLGGGIGDHLRITNANISSGALVSAYAGNNLTGYDLLRLSSGVTETDRFTISTEGDMYLSRNANIGGNLNVSGNASVSGTLTAASFSGDFSIDQYIKHSGDEDTYLNFEDDSLKIDIGTAKFLHFSEGTDPDVLHGNYNQENIDFRWDSDNYNYLIYADTSTDRLGIGTNTPNYKLDVRGDIYLGGAIHIAGHLLPNNDNQYDIGSSTFEWKDLYIDGTAYIDAARLGTTDYASFNTNGDLTFVDSDSGSSITGPAGGTLTVQTGSNNNLILNSGTGDVDLTAATFDIDSATIDLSSQATDIEIIDNTASALIISQGANNYFLITTTDDSEIVTLDLPTGGGTSLTGNLFISGIAKTINIGSGTAIDDINIGTGGTGADDIDIGDALADVDITGASQITAGTGDSLTITANAASTWSTSAGILTLQGDDGVNIESGAAGGIKLDPFDNNVLPGSASTDSLGAVGTEWLNIYVDTVTAGAISISDNITMTDDNWIGLGAGAGRIIFDDQTPDEIKIADAKLRAGAWGSPIDVGSTREYGVELHYSGNNNNVTGLRSRANLITTDTSANARGANIQAANSDGVNAGTITGLNVEALGKSTDTAATIADLIGIHINTEWEDEDTIGNMKGLYLRLVTDDTAPTGDSYGIHVYNQQKAEGINSPLDAGIKIDTNIPNGTSAYTYGIDMYDAANASQIATADIRLSDGSTISGGGSIILSPGGVEKMRILDNGNVGIGTTGPGSRLDVETDVSTGFAAEFFNDGNNADRYGIKIRAGADDSVGDNRMITFYDGDATLLGYITNDDGMIEIEHASDERLKENIINSSPVLTDINRLRVVDFNFKQNNVLQTGLIAQEVKEIFPDAVSYNSEEDMYSLKTLKFIPKIIKAIQEQQEIIENLEEEIGGIIIDNAGDVEIIANTYDGILENQNDLRNLSYVIEKGGELVDRIGVFGELIVGKVKAGLVDTKALIADRAIIGNLSISSNLRASQVETDRLISPLVESENLIARTIETEMIKPAPDKDLVVNLSNLGSLSYLRVQGEEGKEVFSLDSKGNAAFSGELTAQSMEADEGRFKKLYAESIEGLEARINRIFTSVVPPSEESLHDTSEEELALELGSEIASISSQLATISNQLSTISNYDYLDISSLDADSGIFNEFLAVLGQAVMTNLEVTNSLVINNSMNISSNSINNLNTIYLQKTGLGGIDLMAGALTIGEDGNVYVAGDLHVGGAVYTESLESRSATVSGSLAAEDLNTSNLSVLSNLRDSKAVKEEVASIDASGSATFRKLNIASAEATPSAGFGEIITEVTVNAPTGQAVLAAYDTEITIKSPFVTDKSLVYITPETDTNNQVLYVKSKDVGQFTISINKATEHDIKFNFWIIN